MNEGVKNVSRGRAPPPISSNQIITNISFNGTIVIVLILGKFRRMLFVLDATWNLLLLFLFRRKEIAAKLNTRFLCPSIHQNNVIFCYFFKLISLLRFILNFCPFYLAQKNIWIKFKY